MSDKNVNQALSHPSQGQYIRKVMNQQKILPKSTGISWNGNLMQGQQQSLILKESVEFDCFKDDNLRVPQGTGRPYVERGSINLFRKQKRIKWIEVLNEQHDNEPLPKQSDVRKEQKIDPLPMSIANLGKNSTILNHRSISQAMNRQVHTSLERNRQKSTRKTSTSATFSIQKISASKQRYSRQKHQILPQQMKFQVQPKPMIERIPTKAKGKTKEQLRRFYSPSRIFHKHSKSNRESKRNSEEAQILKAWQLSDQGYSNEIEEYTEQLFSCETLDLRPPSLTYPPRIIYIRRK